MPTGPPCRSKQLISVNQGEPGPKETAAVKLLTRGRITIPRDFREALDLQTGDEVLFEFEDGCLLLTAQTQQVSLTQDVVRRESSDGTSAAESATEPPAETARE